MVRHIVPQTGMEPPTEEDAFNFIVQTLKDSPNGGEGTYGYGLYLSKVVDQFLHKVKKIETGHARFYEATSPPFFSAAWALCRRGILRPGIRLLNQQSTDEGNAGEGYSLTLAGEHWIKGTGGKYDYVPTEPGRFASMLDQYTARFGQGFKERSQEAVRCYGALAYLACCAMCGAGAESIFLAAAIAKDGDRAKIEKEYLAAGGRGRIEKRITGSLSQPVADEFKGYVSLLKYWRDSAAHGMVSGIGDPEAWTALATLLRFAQFADARWSDLASP